MSSRRSSKQIIIILLAFTCFRNWVEATRNFPHAKPPKTHFDAPARRTLLTDPVPFINEFHYDNAGTDTSEFIEVAVPFAVSKNSLKVVLYNGNGAISYETILLSTGTETRIAGTTWKLVVINVPGLQNGDPDGIALATTADVLLEFLCYEGAFVPTDGPASGVGCDILNVAELGSDVAGLSLQRTGTGLAPGDFIWNPPSTATPGAVNTGQTFVSTSVPLADPDSLQTFINEIHYFDGEEFIEVAAPAGTLASNLKLVLYDGQPTGLPSGMAAAYDTQSLDGVFTDDDSGWGFKVQVYPGGIQDDSLDGVALVKETSPGVFEVLEFYCYGASSDTMTAYDGPAGGAICVPITLAESDGYTLQRSGLYGEVSAHFTWAASPEIPTKGAASSGQTFLQAPISKEALDPATLQLFINEIHYSTSTGQFIEIAGVADYDLTGHKVILYDGEPSGFPAGSGWGTVYDSRDLVGFLEVPGTEIWGFLALDSYSDYYSRAIKDAGPHGVALVRETNPGEFDTLEFWCVGSNTFTAYDGPSAGVECQAMGVEEVATTPDTQSLQRQGLHGLHASDFPDWAGPVDNTKASQNSGQSFYIDPEPVPVADPTILQTFINEIYRTSGSDFIEVAGISGRNAANLRLVLYNGQPTGFPASVTNIGVQYETISLTDTFPNTVDGWGLKVLEYSSGLQDGSPDGIALVREQDGVVTVLECWAYGGGDDFIAYDGLAKGALCTGVGDSEIEETDSLQRVGTNGLYAASFTWSGTATATQGEVNTGQSFLALQPPPPGGVNRQTNQIFINEFHYDNTGTDSGEFIEVAAPADTDGNTLKLVLYGRYPNTPYNINALSGQVADTTGRGWGFLVQTYNNEIRDGNGGIALVQNETTVLDFICYGEAFTAIDGPADGQTCISTGVVETGTTKTGTSVQLAGKGLYVVEFGWKLAKKATPGKTNGGETLSRAPKPKN